ncbi:zinc finger protein 568-like [Aricia agestis]|uniref:zinc finger protein 568-like n=1 Tax=Aricia agestis TaxID=91739 RepID=UPI001C2051BE|nr:zinc finger protein 568-like [Aricia agestis]
MSSAESDDEPLSVLAAAKKANPQPMEENIDEDTHSTHSKRRKKTVVVKKSNISLKINKKLQEILSPPVTQRPADVWLYLKDLNATGPYTCLLCSAWFINKSKIIMHYALNHKKDFCGICRYFVLDREAWFAHEKFHTPWPCSQCIDSFATEPLLRVHLRTAHNLVHCRLCHFRVPADEEYESHLYQKHNVTNPAVKEVESLWEIDYDIQKYVCLLCSKGDNLFSTFFSHFMGYHHFTLKCLTGIVAGKDPPFLVDGADVSEQFIEDQLKGMTRLGYVDLEQQKMPISRANTEFQDSQVPENLQLEVKLEAFCDEEEIKTENADTTGDSDLNVDYEGVQDFDVTLTEVIVLENSYFDYLDSTQRALNLNTVPENSDIMYEHMKPELFCALCDSKFQTEPAFLVHISKMHNVRVVPLYSCRVCATTFDTQTELKSHITEEMGDFEDLWICQFCDKEFDNRESCRRHLTEHWHSLEFDNCFSPQLGFKCKYCPTLFWNEPEREAHQIRAHINKHKDDFYKCQKCSLMFSDKVWFMFHYLEKHKSDETKYSYLFKCCVCCIVLPSLQDTRSHFKEHHPEAKKTYCSLDPCKFKPLTHRKSLKVHVKSIHGSPKSPKRECVSCAECGRGFATARACSAHATQVHGQGKFKCKLCRDVLHTLDERKLHYLLRHPGRHPFECGDCGKSFQYKSSLYMHKQEHAPNKQDYKCEYCGKIFAKKDSFREHLQIHSGPRHACSYCPMRFVQRSNMLRHERRHTGERPYACPHCPRTFADKGACTAHSRTHSKATSFACIYCGQTFVQKSKLTYHIRKHTGENLESCTVCSKLFTSACSLREHMKIHVENKQIVKCPLCDKKYQDERYMLRHLRTSHTGSTYTCPVCRKCLTSSTGLRHHVLTHSRLNTFRCKVCTKSYAAKKSMIKHLKKRHNLDVSLINTKEYFFRLDPRDCKLGLDEETMNMIFGPKKFVSDVMISDYVTLAKNVNVNKEDKRESSVEQAKESDKSDSGMEFDTVNIKQEVHSEENSLEPTDFVSVKIENVDDSYNEETT